MMTNTDYFICSGIWLVNSVEWKQLFLFHAPCVCFTQIARKMDTVMGFNDEESSAGLEQGGA